LRKILISSVFAVVLGILLVLIPLIVLADIKAENHDEAMAYLDALPEQMKKFERTTNGLDTPAYLAADLQVLAVSFIIASVVYVLFKRRMS